MVLCYFTLTRVVKRLPLVCIGSRARGYLFTLYRLLPSAVAEGVALVASVPVDHAGKEKNNCDLWDVVIVSLLPPQKWDVCVFLLQVPWVFETWEAFKSRWNLESPSWASKLIFIFLSWFFCFMFSLSIGLLYLASGSPVEPETQVNASNWGFGVLFWR